MLYFIEYFSIDIGVFVVRSFFLFLIIGLFLFKLEIFYKVILFVVVVVIVILLLEKRDKVVFGLNKILSVIKSFVNLDGKRIVI